MQTKSELRKKILEKRKNLDLKFIAQVSVKISGKIIHLPEFINAKNIGYYSAIAGEVDLSLIEKFSKELNKNLFLPVISKDKKSMQFYSPTLKFIETYQLDLILVPLVAFDHHNNRLGFGAGFYDRCLEFKMKNKLLKPILIGIAYAFQQVDLIQTESFDVPMDFVVTENKISKKR